MLGGMWGANSLIDRDLSMKIFSHVLEKSVNERYNQDKNSLKGYDQAFLKDYVYELIRDRSTIHDSYSCLIFRDSKPFPSQRKVNDFIGSIVSSGDIPSFQISECPRECRPNDHQDWIFC